MRSHPAAEQSKSLKTFFIYSAIVLFFIITSLAIKTYFIIQNNKYDSNQQFVLAVAKDDKTKELIIFHPEHSVTLVTLSGKPISLSSVGKTMGVLPDGQIDTKKEFPMGEQVGETIKAYAFNYQSLKTNLTIFDLIGLVFASQKAAINNQINKEIAVSANSTQNDTLVGNLFVDQTLFSENVSIQIINSSGVSGMGKRLETVLSNVGANVVALSTSRAENRSSKIQYFGEETYTLLKLKKLLGFPVEKIEKEAIANIVITVGEDQVRTTKF
jgi:hypothetical protein